MKLIIYSLGFMIFWAGLTAHATNKVGNGGNVVVCKLKTGSTYQLLDFYENDVQDQSITYKKLNEIEITQKVIEKIQSVAPEIYRQYFNRLQKIKNEFDVRKGIQLVTVDDSLHAFKPKSKDCGIVQTIIRKDQALKNEKRFLVDEEVWGKLNSFQKSGLVLHEIIYEHFFKLSEKDSVKARKLNAFLFKGPVDEKGFWGLIKELDIAIYPE